MDYGRFRNFNLHHDRRRAYEHPMMSHATSDVPLLGKLLSVLTGNTSVANELKAPARW